MSAPNLDAAASVGGDAFSALSIAFLCIVLMASLISLARERRKLVRQLEQANAAQQRLGTMYQAVTEKVMTAETLADERARRIEALDAVIAELRRHVGAPGSDPP